MLCFVTIKIPYCLPWHLYSSTQEAVAEDHFRLSPPIPVLWNNSVPCLDRPVSEWPSFFELEAFSSEKNSERSKISHCPHLLRSIWPTIPLSFNFLSQILAFIIEFPTHSYCFIHLLIHLIECSLPWYSITCGSKKFSFISCYLNTLPSTELTTKKDIWFV